MQKYVMIQVFTAVLSILLAFIFYLLIEVNIITNYRLFQNFFDSLLLIIVAIIGLAILAVLAQIAGMLEKGHKRGKS